MIAQNMLEAARSAREGKAAARKDRESDTTIHTVPELGLDPSDAPNPPLLDEYEDTEPPRVESANTFEDE